MDSEEESGFRALLLALGIDNFGSGMFLPLTMLYLTRVVGISVGTAGILVAVASILGLALPAVAARLVDTVGARSLVSASQLLQAAGMLAYLAAGGEAVAAAGALLSVAGLQLFYSCLNALVVDVVGEAPKDRPFAMVARVRGASFGVGALVGGILASLSNPGWLRGAVAFDVVTFVLAAFIGWLAVPSRAHLDRRSSASHESTRVRPSMPFLLLMVVAFCVSLPTDFFLSGNAVYVTRYLGVAAWVIGFSVALLTAVSSTMGTTAVRLTDRFSRVTTQAIGICFLLAWAVLSAFALAVPANGRLPLLVVVAALLAIGNVIPMARLAAMAEATAPAGYRGMFLAVFQYPFSLAQVVGPALTSLLAVAAWLPWAVNSVALLVALVALRRVRRQLPHTALYPSSHPAVLVSRCAETTRQ